MGKNPLHINAQYNLAIMLARVKKFDEAIVHLKNIVIMQDRHTKALYKLGEVYEKKGEARTALGYFRRTCNLSVLKGCRRVIKLSE